jgi:type IV secretion system protein VirB10
MASVSPPGRDPRAATAPAGSEQSVAPQVPVPRGGPSGIVIAIGLAILAVILFTTLDARRRALQAPAVRLGAADRAAAGAISAPPPALFIPPAPEPQPLMVEVSPPIQQAPARMIPPPAQPQIVYVPQPVAPQQQGPIEAPVPPARASTGSALVYDAGGNQQGGAATTPDKAGEGAASEGQSGAPAAGSVAGARVRAGVLANRAATVPQGTLIPAVLETGFDSTRPGLARAMVTRDVRGFDGSKVLISRGSRLIGEYRSDTQPGQKRALINWTRLIRPDGVTIAIGSQASDPVGRGGVAARVNNHFFARFAGAILQSSLDIGVNLASRSAGSPVIVALPGAVQNTTQPLRQNQQYTPTLTVRPGTSITIFVARDLDFTGAGANR